jgi:hypothetical protein
MASGMLLRLPGEIRNQIYEMLLIIPAPRVNRPLGGGPKIHPQILYACRQMYHEAAAILYGMNTFIAHYSLLSGMPQLRRWLDPITSATLISLIRRFHVYVRLDCDAHFTAATARDAFSGIEELTVEAFQTQFGSSDYTVLRLFEEVRGVKKVRILGSISAFPEYVSWLESAMASPKDAKVLDYEPTDAEVHRDLWTVSDLHRE